MKLTMTDLGRIKFSMLGAVVMIAAGATTVGLSSQFLKVEQRAARQAENRQKEVQSQLARARDEEAEIKSKIVLFNRLLGRGIIGEERRLDWVEEIRRIREEHRLLQLRYELAPQQTLESAIAPGASGSFEFLASTMRLEMDLLHEEDLLHLIDGLRVTASAFLRPRSCTMERRAPGIVSPGAIPGQLQSRCTIDWITVRERKPNA